MKLRIVIDGRAYEVEVEDAEQEGDSDSPGVLHIQSSVLPNVPKLDTSSDFDESKVCRSPLAGVVSQLQVSSGQTVEANDTLLVLDAMKMEIKVSAHHAGTVKAIDVAPGDAVKPNQILIWFQ